MTKREKELILARFLSSYFMSQEMVVRAYELRDESRTGESYIHILEDPKDLSQEVWINLNPEQEKDEIVITLFLSSLNNVDYLPVMRSEIYSYVSNALAKSLVEKD